MKFYFKCFMFLLLLLFFTIRLHFNLKNNKKNCDIFDDPYDPKCDKILDENQD